MTPFERLMQVFRVLKPADGWTCVRLTNVKAILRHTDHGERVCWIDGGGKIAIRGGVPIELHATKHESEQPFAREARGDE